MKDKYYTIQVTEDGDVFIHEYDDKDKMLSQLGEGGYEEGVDFCRTIPNVDVGSWKASQGIIIKGQIVVPKPKEVVKEWDII